jgi:hypothetical protein
MGRVAFNDAGLDGVGENAAEETNGARSRSSAASDDGLSAQILGLDRNSGLSSHYVFEDLVDVGLGEVLDPGGLTVTFYNGTKPPCPCVVDGVMIATQASPGQGTLQVSPEKAPDGMMAVIVIKEPQDR